MTEPSHSNLRFLRSFLEKIGRLVFLLTSYLVVILPSSFLIASSLKLCSTPESVLNKSGALSLGKALNVILIDWTWTDWLNTFITAIILLILFCAVWISKHLLALSREKLHFTPPSS